MKFPFSKIILAVVFVGMLGVAVPHVQAATVLPEGALDSTAPKPAADPFALPANNSSANTPAPSSAAPSTGISGSNNFVALTQLPGLSTLTGSSPTLPAFINNLYKIAIGLAAFFAFVQIIWAGFLFMSSADNVGKNTKARAKIMNAIMGLVIVLSPFVVFSIINPSILNISLNFGALKGAAPASNISATGGAGSVTCTPACTNGLVCSNGNCVSSADATNEKTCEAYTTIDGGQSDGTCASGESSISASCCAAGTPHCCGK